MNVYIYQADLWCENCIENVKKIQPDLKIPDGFPNENTYDSDDYPKGAYPNGGGEADAPQHCAGCSIHLENPLTSDGYEYVKQALLKPIEDKPVLAEWFEFYGFDINLI